MTRAYLGISASSMKKMYYSHLHELRDALKKDRGELGSEDYAAAGDSLLDQLFSGHRDRKAWREAPLTGEVRLIRVDIERVAAGISRRRSFITSMELSP